MSAMRFRSSRPDDWVMPRPHLDAHQRYQTYGPIQPMDKPGLLERMIDRLSGRK